MNHRVIVLATRNQGKIDEFRALFSGFDCEMKNLHDFGPLPPVEEDGKTFEENAYKKAHFSARVLGLPAIADDSGLVVAALNGAPGVFSARFAGEKATDRDNVQKLLHALREHDNRKAYFETVIALAVPRGPALMYTGRCEGEIAREPKGFEGFGYDPVFYYPPLNKTFAQLSREEKNKISHRGKAMAEFRSEFFKVMIWLDQRMMEEQPHPDKYPGSQTFLDGTNKVGTP